MRCGLVFDFFLSTHINHFSQFGITDWEVLIIRTLSQLELDPKKMRSVQTLDKNEAPGMT